MLGKASTRLTLLVSTSICLLVSAALPASLALAEIEYSLDSPESTVDSLHRALVRVAGDDAMETVDARFVALLPLVRATHDIEYIAELSVRRNWSDFDSDQQARFIDAFARLSAMTYAARFGGVGEQTFERVRSEESIAGRVQVLALIKPAEGDNVTLDYLLQKNEEGWQIVNIIADGVSDLALKRSEYRGVLSDGSVEDLIRYVERQSEELLD